MMGARTEQQQATAVEEEEGLGGLGIKLVGKPGDGRIEWGQRHGVVGVER